MLNGAPITAERPHNHTVLIQDAGILDLALVGIAKGDGRRADQRRVGPNRQQAKPALTRLRL